MELPPPLPVAPLLSLAECLAGIQSHEQCPCELALPVPTLKHRGCGSIALRNILTEQQHWRGGCQGRGAALFLHRQPLADTGP